MTAPTLVPTPAPKSVRPRRRKIYWIAGAVAVVAAVVAFAVWFLRDDAPERVSIDDAASQLVDSPGPDAAVAATAAPTVAPAAETTSPAATAVETPTNTAGDLGTDAGISGVWSVDTSIGEFSYEESTGTFVGFRVSEELLIGGATEAVGRTPAVSGELVIDGTTISGVTIEADMTAITTNESRRDDKVHQALETDLYPTATFALTEPIELDEAALTGATVSVDAVGELTIHGVTHPVTFPLEARLVDSTIVVVGSLDIVFGDFGVEVPSAPVVLSADDHGPIELQLFFTR